MLKIADVPPLGGADGCFLGGETIVPAVWFRTGCTCLTCQEGIMAWYCDEEPDALRRWIAHFDKMRKAVLNGRPIGRDGICHAQLVRWSLVNA